MLSDPNKTPATATEVAERMADLANRTAGGFSRLFYEFLQPYMRRCLYILERRGDIELPVQNGRAIKFRAVSPLAQAQNGRDLQMMMQHHQILSVLYGPQISTMAYETELVIPWLNEKLGVDSRLVKEPQKIVEAIAKMAEQMAQMQQMQGGAA
jgi:hypothetical protein